MRIDIWSDFTCPFCYIGKRHLEMALKNRKDVEIVFHSFELDPYAQIFYKENIYELIAKKYGITIEESTKNINSIKEMATSAGLNYDFDNVKNTNTLTAHRLSQYANEKSVGNLFVETLFNGFFTKGAFLSDEETLVNLAGNVGIGKDEALDIIRSDKYKDKVREDEEIARDLNITSVPFFIFDKKYTISGAQPVSNFEKVIKELDNKDQV